MSRIEWTTTTFETVGPHRIPLVPDLADGYRQGAGIRRNAPLTLLLKAVLWPLLACRDGLMTDGFIERETGRLIARYLTADSVFLEIGCGDLSLRKYLPEEYWYNALDLELSDFHLLRALGSRRTMNIVVSSATRIPARDRVASLIVATETFEHIPEIESALAEIRRVARPDAVLICSIPNNYCRKYAIRGPHPGHVHAWTFAGFREFMAKQGFACVEGFMKGRWLPLPSWLSRTPWQLPLSPAAERDNTNFFYVFRISA